MRHYYNILSNGYAYEVKMHARQDIYETKQKQTKQTKENMHLNCQRLVFYFLFFYRHVRILLRLFCL